jgi:hypothetical protein
MINDNIFCLNDLMNDNENNKNEDWGYFVYLDIETSKTNKAINPCYDNSISKINYNEINKKIQKLNLNTFNLHQNKKIIINFINTFCVCFTTLLIGYKIMFYKNYK